MQCSKLADINFHVGFQSAGKIMVTLKPYFSIAATLISILAGCGGSDSTSPGEFIGVTTTSTTAAVTGSAEGLYAGTASNGQFFNTLVLENNQYYIIYGNLFGDAFNVGGLLTGTGQASNGNFTSTDLREFPALGLPILGTLSAIYSPGVSFNAVAVTRGTAVTYTGSSLATTNYTYNTRAKLTDIAGVWNMLSAQGLPVTLNISTTGTYTGALPGCTVSGTIVPRASGKNVFDVTIQFGPAPCALADQTASGHAVTYLLANGKRELIVMGSDVTRTVATVLTGVR
jgi:hypothetical protein